MFLRVVLELFSSVMRGPPVNPESKLGIPIWEAGKLYKLEAVKDVHFLELQWTLPSLRKDYLKKADKYLAHLLGDERRGSLHLFLNARGWVTSISVGDSEDWQCSLIAYVFGMAIHLTDTGLEKIFEIIGFVYQYIKLLRQISPQEWIFKELQDIANMDFRFAEEQPQEDYAAGLAANLLVYPPDHAIYGDYAYEIWDEEFIKYVLEYLRPENMRIDIVTKSLNKSANLQKEPWFGSQYLVEDVPSSLMQLWKDPPEIDVSLHLPAKNEFIPRDFSIRADDPSLVLADVSFPRCVLDEPLMKLWYKLDKTFKHPRANTYFQISLKGGNSNLKNALLTELFVHMLKDELNETRYQASIAKLDSSVSLNGDKLELKVYGFNDKLSVLLSKFLTVSRTFAPKDDRFKVIKERMEISLRNTNMDPLDHLSYSRLQVMYQNFWDVDEKLCLLNCLSLADLRLFIPDLLSQLYIEGLCHGNLRKEEALAITNIFKSNFSLQPLPFEMRHREQVMCLPPGADLIRDVQVKNKLETISVID